MNTKEFYREFSQKESSLPIFSRDWWLDAAAGPDAWDVTMVRKGDHVLAAMPYVMRRRFGLKVLTQPALTQKLGPWIRPIEGKPSHRLATEKELMQALIDQLPVFDHFIQNWHYGRTNWLPFSWKGFQQSTRYTYVVTGITDTEQVWARMEDNVRNHCKKAVSRFKLEVRDDLPLDTFLELNRLTYRRQGLAVPYSDDFVRRLDEACAQRGCRRLLTAIDPEGRRHAGLYYVWDENSAYGLMAGADPALRNSGANSLCHWEAMKHAAQVTQQFDFAGSMLEPVERFFRGFGAIQLPYFKITKTPSRLLRVREGLLFVMRTA
jgi:hypothetical protein